MKLEQEPGLDTTVPRHIWYEQLFEAIEVGLRT